jgi:hypothetical protein
MADLEPDEATAIVTVEEIVHAPPILARCEGKDITVRLPAKKKLALGAAAVFFANGLRVGETIAVQAVDLLPPAQAMAPERAALAVRQDPVESLVERELRKGIAEADAVVSGRVKSVRVAVSAAERQPKSTPAPQPKGVVPPLQRISEHDPIWQEAVVEVQEVHKGSGAIKEIVVRFPKSKDVHWYKSPKFEPGHEGVFILRKPAEAEGIVTVRRGAPKESLFIADRPGSFQPGLQAEKVRSLMKRQARGGSSRTKKTGGP